MVNMPKDKADPMLWIGEAATLMGLSRPWVAMLIDYGELPGATVSPEGSREVPKSAVLNWLSHNKQEGSSDYRKAGRLSGIYGVEETTVA